MLGHALALRGCRAEAEEILRQLDCQRATEYVSGMAAAVIKLGLGDRDEFFERIEGAVRDKSGWLVYLKTDPRLDPVRGDCRFDRLLEAVGLGAGDAA
jgi:hypothetical protein